MSTASWDQSKFDAALDEYLKVTDRTVTEVLNTKAYYIARKALWFTKRADSGSIAKELGNLVSVTSISTRGRLTTRKTLNLVGADQHDAPLAALIVNKRLGKGHGLYGAAMEKAIRNLLASRMRSIAFLKSGWLPAIRVLSLYAKDKSNDSIPAGNEGARIYGREKGAAYPAVEGTSSIVATIINSAIAAHDKKDALQLFGSKALQTAFDDEAADMESYMARKLEDPTAHANAKLES